MVKPVNPVDSNQILEVLNESTASLREAIADQEQWQKISEKLIIPMFNVIKATILQLPTVRAFSGAEEYGYWEPGLGLKVRCSCCKNDTLGGKTNFCPNCGIPMKEKQDVLARLQ